MESSDLQALLHECPLLIRTNNGVDYLVEQAEFITVGDYTASLLFSDDHGIKRHAVIGLMNISAVEPQSEAP